MKKLKYYRIALSIVFFLALTGLLTGIFGPVSYLIFKPVLHLQFIPSLLNLFVTFGISAVSLTIILVLTFLFGRIYCSSICPIGTLQDFFSFLSGKLKSRKAFKIQKNYKIKYFFLTFFIFCLISGINIGVSLLDPYSNYGRMVLHIVKPVFFYINNSLTDFFGFLSHIEIQSVFLNSFLITSIVFTIIFIFSLRSGRLFCNTVCPVGTFLGLLSKKSFYKIKIDKENCIRCGKCIKVCKSGCIEPNVPEVYFDNCVLCFNCLHVCKSESITFKKSYSQNNKISVHKADLDKRNFIFKSMAYSLGLLGLSEYVSAKVLSQKVNKNVLPAKLIPVAPPGSESIGHFTDFCTSCHLCISVCPTGVLKPSFLEYGFTGMMQPYLDFTNESCEKECTKCGEVCPTGAIKKINQEEKKVTKIGEAKFILENCLVYTENKRCLHCFRHCPYQAINIKKQENGLIIPEPDNNLCVGCGKCENVCDAEPKAIFVDGLKIHKVLNG